VSNLLLQTKLTPPLLRQGLVTRPQLLGRLGSDLLQPGGFSRKLTLVCAPAGYGKTALIVSWLSSLTIPFAWLSLDEGDNDPTRFLSYLIAAAQQVQAGTGAEARALLASPQPPPVQTILTSLINDLNALQDPLILALDDYHAVQSDRIHQNIAFLIERQPNPLHLVILSREEPLLPLHRLRAQWQMLEIRQEDLRFSVTETSDYFDQGMGIRLDQADIEALNRRTEGWIVGLQLAALSLRNSQDIHAFVQSFTGSNRYVLDYLFQEVLQQQSPELQSFLLKSSILERLTGSLCNALTGRLDGNAQLEALEKANLFIVPIDPERRWFRYHQLFADLLHHQLHLKGEPGEKALHERACQWYAQNDLASEAVKHAVAAEDWERAAELIEQAGGALLKRGELVTLIGWCEQLPSGVFASRASLALSYTWALAMLGKFDRAESLLLEIEETASPFPPLMGQVAAVQSYVARGKGDNARAIDKSQQALALLPESDSQLRSVLALNQGLLYWHAGQLGEASKALSEVLSAARQSGNHYALLTAQIFLARTLASQGELRRANEMYQQILQIPARAPILALAHFDLCGVYYEWNDLVKAGEHLEKGMELCVQSGNLEFQNSGHILKAYLLLARGNPRGALVEIEESHSLSREFNPATQARSAACHAQISLATGDIKTAEHWAAQMAEEVDAHPFYRFIGLIRPRLLIAQGRKGAASELLREYSARAVEAGWGYAWVAIRILQSLAAGSQAEALETLEEALRASQAEGYIRAYADAGNPLVPLLQEAARRGILPEYVGQILDGLGLGRSQALALTQPQNEPLSTRELEVLRLVTAGLSNREIANQLIISAGTAKTHIHNICGKLGVRNRTEAAMRAKDLNLV
jgi:LuxR family maltose regulon positive regulatory protein